MTQLKTTTSFCPECLKELPAEIHEEADGIYLKKSCEGHGEWSTLIETQ